MTHFWGMYEMHNISDRHDRDVGGIKAFEEGIDTRIPIPPDVVSHAV